MADTDRRARYLRRLDALKTERSSFVSHWQDISTYLLPRRGRFLTTDRNKGDRRNSDIIDNTGTIAHRTLASGLMSGVTSPARPWFRLGAPDPALAEDDEVKTWLSDVERLMREVFNRSSLYNALYSVYEELAAFGTAAMLVYENMDPEGPIITCQTLTAGEYWVAQNSAGQVDTLYREYSMTVGQLVEEFGEDAVSQSVRDQYRKGRVDEWVEVVHAIEPSRKAGGKPFVEVWFEKGGRVDAFLREGGYDEFPAMCPRWHLAGSDIYGRAPAMDALGDVMQLQVMEKRLAQAIDKMVNPPLTAPTTLRGAPINALPGGVNFVDDTGQGGNGGIRSMYEVQPRTVEMQNAMDFVRRRIQQAFYADVWMIVTDIERSNVTATEIDARRQEKLLMLGPVLERLHHELLDPLIDRVFGIMVRKSAPFWALGVRGPLLPPPPEALAGQPLRVEYISILAEAQKSVAVGSIERLMSFVGSLAAVKPEVLDKVDFDQTVDEYREAIGAPVKMVVSDDKVTDIRKARASMQAKMQQMQAMQNAATTAQTGAQAAKVLSETDTGGQNALTAMLGAAVG
ncbi:portal protein [Magnetospirillum fulvum]|uniref:Phage head-tail connector protein n=1 Tax=Magnetospirillum fulvum MGU-K5 TaxID=1316936 RepID=S9SHA3_MAGFU|nr:portal protein [Magnetospirillum fulvum]EPY03498.1 phage head-tail connector protein [Magnetospirillum fulvum MGU-K5]